MVYQFKKMYILNMQLPFACKKNKRRPGGSALECVSKGKWSYGVTGVNIQ